MTTKQKRRAAAAVILASLLSFTETKTVQAQGAAKRIKRVVKRISPARPVVKAVNSIVAVPEQGEADPNGPENKVPPVPAYGSENFDREIAAAFAPVFYQGLGPHPRYDYITNFDFDGDWRGDNNWVNAADGRFPLEAYVYYSVAETATHYFITYAVFHPRDYKGGNVRGRILSNIIELGVSALGRHDPTGRAAEATLAHENDLEGALVVAEKRGSRLTDARVRYVETLAHNRFYKYEPRPDTVRDGIGRVRLSGGRRAELYIEPRGHGINARQPEKANERRGKTLVYQYAGRSESSEQRRSERKRVGYALVPLYTTLWERSLPGENQTYAEAHDYRELLAAISTRRSGGKTLAGVSLDNKVGSAFRGEVGGTNMARPPWGWFDGTERERTLGEWFFDPAVTVKRHFNLGESFSTGYEHAPAVGISRLL